MSIPMAVAVVAMTLAFGILPPILIADAVAHLPRTEREAGAQLFGIIWVGGLLAGAGLAIVNRDRIGRRRIEASSGWTSAWIWVGAPSAVILPKLVPTILGLPTVPVIVAAIFGYALPGFLLAVPRVLERARRTRIYMAEAAQKRERSDLSATQ